MQKMRLIWISLVIISLIPPMVQFCRNLIAYIKRNQHTRKVGNHPGFGGELQLSGVSYRYHLHTGWSGSTPDGLNKLEATQYCGNINAS